MALGWKGCMALVVFILQNSTAALLMRYAKLNSAPYNSSVAVLLQEGAVKLPVALFLYTIECGGPVSMINALLTDLKEHRVEWLQLGVPAILYTIQNNMLYVGYANLDAAVGMLTYQSKTLFTAVFSIALLGKSISPVQWLALLVLMAGVIGVQDVIPFVKWFGASLPAADAAVGGAGAASAHLHHHLHKRAHVPHPGRVLGELPAQASHST
jgi:UDP-sugar transporter A1/2/3